LFRLKDVETLKLHLN